MVNRHRLYWSAMGSPKSDEEIDKGMLARKDWHNSLVEMWDQEGWSYRRAISSQGLQDAVGMMPLDISFHWSVEGIKEAYLNASDRLKKHNLTK